MDSLGVLNMRLTAARKCVQQRDALYKLHGEEITRCRNLGRQPRDTDAEDQALRDQQIIHEMISLSRLRLVKGELGHILREHTSTRTGNLASVLCLLASRSGRNILTNCLRQFPDILRDCQFVLWANEEEKYSPSFSPGLYEVVDRYSFILSLHISLYEEHGLDGLDRLLSLDNLKSRS